MAWDVCFGLVQSTHPFCLKGTGLICEPGGRQQGSRLFVRRAARTGTIPMRALRLLFFASEFQDLGYRQANCHVGCPSFIPRRSELGQNSQSLKPWTATGPQECRRVDFAGKQEDPCHGLPEWRGSCLRRPLVRKLPAMRSTGPRLPSGATTWRRRCSWVWGLKFLSETVLAKSGARLCQTSRSVPTLIELLVFRCALCPALPCR